MKQYLYPTNILLPKEGFEKWAVIACDQYTSDKAYWQDVERTVGDAPSTLRMVLPEIYLGETQARIGKINQTMNRYLENGTFDVLEDSMVYIEREITGNGKRCGVLGLVDLAQYSYEAGSKALIRATEKTVIERIPPRVKIRRDAPLEFPHVLLFINDPDDTVIAAAKAGKTTKLYDFDLMKNGGHIEGYQLQGDVVNVINEKLGALVQDDLLFAVGDGNHSLATAKECYNQNPNELNRYALVEVVNIHNDDIEFEPIYRVLFGIPKETIVSYLLEKNAGETGETTQTFEVVTADGSEELTLNAISKLPVGTLQIYLDEFLKENPQVEIDYIHGVEATRTICQKENAVGFLFDGMERAELFDAVIADGSLPRKTFSMGAADDKRFYIEGRKIK